jgi:hypothetical protein
MPLILLDKMLPRRQKNTGEWSTAVTICESGDRCGLSLDWSRREMDRCAQRKPRLRLPRSSSTNLIIGAVVLSYFAYTSIGARARAAAHAGAWRELELRWLAGLWAGPGIAEELVRRGFIVCFGSLILPATLHCREPSGRSDPVAPIFAIPCNKGLLVTMLRSGQR